MRTHITAALAAIEGQLAGDARREIGAARRALGLYGRTIRTTDRATVEIATTTPRGTIAECLAGAADAMRGDVWPGEEPYIVAEYLSSGSPDDCPQAVSAWLNHHTVLQPAMARVLLRTALELSDDAP